MLKAKLLAMNDMDEYEVILEINGIRLMCFAVVCPYAIEIGKFYPIELSLNINDDFEPKELTKEAFSLKKVGRGYEYVLRGKLTRNKLNVGAFSIQDDFLNQFPTLEGKFIELEVNGIWVTFLPLQKV